MSHYDPNNPNCSGNNIFGLLFPVELIKMKLHRDSELIGELAAWQTD